jgi:hypothetical protein
MICFTTVAIFNMSSLVELGACSDRPILWISCCGRCCCMGCHKLFPCLQRLWLLVLRVLMQLSCVGLLWWEVNWKKNILPEDLLELVVLFSFRMVGSLLCAAPNLSCLQHLRTDHVETPFLCCCLFAEPLLSNSCCIVAYFVVIA